MKETKTYIIAFDEKKILFRLIPEKGRAIRVKKDHKKFEWLQQQETGKVVKINAKGRWTSSKDYDGLYNKLQSESTTDSKPITSKKTKVRSTIKVKENPLPKTKPEPVKSILGYHEVELKVKANMSKYVEVNTSVEETHDELLLEVATFFTTVSFASAPSIQRKFKIGYNRATRIIEALEELSIIKDGKPLVSNTDGLLRFFPNGKGGVSKENNGVNLNIDPKSSKWPVTEKLTCLSCQGKGKITEISIQRGGFLNLKKKEVFLESVCTTCNGVGYSEKQHFPYKLNYSKSYSFFLKSSLNFDLVAKAILDSFLTKDEFTKDELLSFLKFNHDKWDEVEKSFCRNFSFLKGSEPSSDDVPVYATWEMVQEVSDKLNEYSAFMLIDANGFIAPLFKTEIIDNGTKRRSTKDDNIYYKFTKTAKKLYKSL